MHKRRGSIVTRVRGASIEEKRPYNIDEERGHSQM